jgi:hypothetical protein
LGIYYEWREEECKCCSGKSGRKENWEDDVVRWMILKWIVDKIGWNRLDCSGSGWELVEGSERSNERSGREVPE